MKWNMEDECKKILDDVSPQKKVNFLMNDGEIYKFIKVVDDTIIFDNEMMEKNLYDDDIVDTIDMMESNGYIKDGTLDKLFFKHYIINNNLDDVNEKYNDYFWDDDGTIDNPHRKVLNEMLEFAKEHNKDCYDRLIELDKELEEEAAKNVIPSCSNCETPVVSNFCPSCGTKREE